MQKTILIVEDHNDSRNVLSFLLKNYGYKIVEAKSGMEAIKAVQQQLPALILMDLYLPDIDGVTATKTIRELEEIPQIPIFAITAHSLFYDTQAREAGFNGVIDKPVDHLQLVRILSRYL
jgi:CheY-like chemotaxis protein